MSYLQVKNHALLNYTKMELYFTLLKVRMTHMRMHIHDTTLVLLFVLSTTVLTPSLLLNDQLEAPENVQDHPIFKELVRYRTLLERIRCVAFQIVNYYIRDHCDILMFTIMIYPML